MTYQFSAPAATDPMSRTVKIKSGASTLVGRLVSPAHPPKAVVIVNPATGVKARFYEPFAEWLAQEKGIACLTYDYRDFGSSAKGAVRGSKATMSDWGVHDQQAVRDWTARVLPDVPIWIIGHSLGGFLLPFQRNLDSISRVITVASGPVHVSEHPWPYQGLARIFWFGHAPLFTRLLGYLPGKRLGFGPDLPAGVYWQWRKWCTSRSFFADDFGTALPFPDWTGVTCPVKVVAISDDVMVPPKSVWKLMDFYRGAHVSQKTLRPEAYGLAEIGHINAFAPENAACWDALIN